MDAFRLQSGLIILTSYLVIALMVLRAYRVVSLHLQVADRLVIFTDAADRAWLAPQEHQ